MIHKKTYRLKVKMPDGTIAHEYSDNTMSSKGITLSRREVFLDSKGREVKNSLLDFPKYRQKNQKSI